MLGCRAWIIWAVRIICLLQNCTILFKLKVFPFDIGNFSFHFFTIEFHLAELIIFLINIHKLLSKSVIGFLQFFTLFLVLVKLTFHELNLRIEWFVCLVVGLFHLEYLEVDSLRLIVDGAVLDQWLYWAFGLVRSDVNVLHFKFKDTFMDENRFDFLIKSRRTMLIYWFVDRNENCYLHWATKSLSLS